MNKRVLITGASRGIGRATALRLAREGSDIALHFNANTAAAEETQAHLEQLGVQVTLLQFDIADRQACHDVLTADCENNGAYYGVVCNAGVSRDNAFPAIEGVDWDAVVHTNLNGFYNVLHPIIMPMIRTRKPGRIVTLSSVSGIMGNRGQVNYSAAKAGIIGASKALAVELAKRKITVNCVAPGMIETDMIEDAPVEEAMKIIPAQRLGNADEVAGLINYLMSEEAGYITRQVISINGGML